MPQSIVEMSQIQAGIERERSFLRIQTTFVYCRGNSQIPKAMSATKPRQGVRLAIGATRAEAPATPDFIDVVHFHGKTLTEDSSGSELLILLSAISASGSTQISFATQAAVCCLTMQAVNPFTKGRTSTQFWV
jgi:hypothetical protein